MGFLRDTYTNLITSLLTVTDKNGFRIRHNGSAEQYLRIKSGSTQTAERTLTVVTGDANRTLDLTAGGGGVTGGDAHDHYGGDGAQINHTTLSNIGTNTHATIDTRLAIYRYISEYASLTLAVAGIGATEATLVIDADTTITADLTVPATLSIIALKGNLITHAAWTITINGNFDAGLFQVFDGTGTVLFWNAVTSAFTGEFARPEWFGGGPDASAATNTTAFNKAITSHHALQLAAGAYYINSLNKVTRSTSITVKGIGQGTFIVGSGLNTNPLFTIGDSSNLVSNAHFKNFNFYFTSAGQTLPAFVRLNNAINATFENLLIQGDPICAFDNIVGWGHKWINCKFTGCDADRGINLLHLPAVNAITSETFVSGDIVANAITGMAADASYGRGIGLPVYLTTTETLPTPLSENYIYYIVRISSTSIKLARSYEEAIGSPAVPMTLSGGSGTHTLHYNVGSHSNIMSIDNCDFTSTMDRAINIVGDGSVFNISNCTIEGNNIGILGGTVTLSDNGGGYINWAGPKGVSAINSYFEGNTTADIYVADYGPDSTDIVGQITIQGCSFDPASDVAKTAIYLAYYGSALIINSYGRSAMAYTKMRVEGAAIGSPNVSLIDCYNYETTGAALTKRTTLGGDLKLISGTTGAINLLTAETTGTPSGSTTYFDIAVAVPSGARLKGVQLRVDTALTTGETWGAAFITGSTTTIAAAGQAVAKNTKVNLIIPDESTTGTTNIRITRDAGNFTDAVGVIRAIVYYESLTAMADAA
jgi:hypothetical protein